MNNANKEDESNIGEIAFRRLLSDLISGDAIEAVCIVPRKDGSIDRVRFFIDDQGLLRRSLL